MKKIILALMLSLGMQVHAAQSDAEKQAIHDQFNQQNDKINAEIKALETQVADDKAKIGVDKKKLQDSQKEARRQRDAAFKSLAEQRREKAKMEKNQREATKKSESTTKMTPMENVHADFKGKAADMSKRHQQELNGVVNNKYKDSMADHNAAMKEWQTWRTAYLADPAHTVNDSEYKVKQKEAQSKINKAILGHSGTNAAPELRTVTARHRQEQQALQAEYDKALAGSKK